MDPGTGGRFERSAGPRSASPLVGTLLWTPEAGRAGRRSAGLSNSSWRRTGMIPDSGAGLSGRWVMGGASALHRGVHT